jgi:hypothetical protein
MTPDGTTRMGDLGRHLQDRYGDRRDRLTTLLLLPTF